jgi:hypothetical protein
MAQRTLQSKDISAIYKRAAQTWEVVKRDGGVTDGTLAIYRDLIASLKYIGAVAWYSDNRGNTHPTIVSLSLGAVRRF